MSAHFEIREGWKVEGPHGAIDRVDWEKGSRDEPSHEWVALVGGNGETIVTTETYPIGHGTAGEAVETIIRAVEEAKGQPIRRLDR